MDRSNLFSHIESCFNSINNFNSNIFNSKRAISPVVATALLLVVAVVAVVGFQTWFGTFSSSMFTKVEQESGGGSLMQLNIETIVSANTIYLKNSNTDSIEILSVKVNGNDCYVSGDYRTGMLAIFLGNCITKGAQNEVVIVTNLGIISKNLMINDDYTNPCPTGYILVPGNSELNTTNFCVMKYEAKNNGSVATSQASGSPWVSITQYGARANCSALGSNYHLITDNEWLTIAHNVEIVSSNWNSSVVGTGFIYSGHNDNSPSSALGVTDENDYYNGTENSAPSNQKRTLVLSNNEVIWDLSGNVWEWDNDSMPIIQRYHGGDGQWMSYNSNDGFAVATNVPILKLPSNGWNANNGMGRYYDGFSLAGAYNSVNEAPDFCTSYCSPTAAFLRGGDWGDGAYAGVFLLGLHNGPSYSSADIGFRCSYAP